MSTHPLRVGCLFVVSALVVGCTESAAPTAVADLNGLGPRFTFINGPNTANVFRREQGFIAVVEDPESSLLLFAGLPADPGDLCRDVLDSDPMSVQFAGLLQDAFNVLALGRGINIHVYDLTTFTCVDIPIAQGTGNLTVNVNDAPNVGPGANSFSWRIQGTLNDLVNGGKVRVTAATHFLLLPDDSFRVLRNSVDLHPIGK